MISCLTLLAVQQLTDARQQQRRFQTAIHLGMAAEDRDQVIRRQMLFWFGLPVAAAVLCSLGVLVFFIGINYEDFTAYLPLSRMFLLSALPMALSSSAALLLYRHISSVPAGHGRPVMCSAPRAKPWGRCLFPTAYFLFK